MTNLFLKLTRTPNQYSSVSELTMTLDSTEATWTELTEEFHNFLRGAGYLIPPQEYE